MSKRRLRGKKETLDMVRDDFDKMLEDDGSEVIFTYIEREGATWNEAYKMWEGGTEEEKTITTKAVGRILDFRENKMEYEFGRISVGDAVIRFRYDFELDQMLGKERLRIFFNGQTWILDSSVEWFDFYAGQPICRAIRGYKAVN
jgi:hypothetical protein